MTFHPFTASDANWLGQLVAINLCIGVLMGSSISHWGHFGGLLGGALAMFLFGPRYKWGTRGQGIVNAPRIPLFK